MQRSRARATEWGCSWIPDPWTPCEICLLFLALKLWGFVWYTPFSSHPAVSLHPFHVPSLCPMGSPHFGFLHTPLVAPQLIICPCCLSPHERIGGTCVGKVQNTLSILPVAHRMCSSTQRCVPGSYCRKQSLGYNPAGCQGC